MTENSYEYERMKEKRRLLQLKINELRADIRRKEEMVSRLEENLKQIRAEQQTVDEEKEPADNRLNVFMKDVCAVISAVAEEDAFMKAKYATQASQIYYKIEKDVFDAYINRLSSMSVKEFIECCKKLSLLKIENNRCTFPSGRTRVYFLTKAIVDELKQ